MDCCCDVKYITYVDNSPISGKGVFASMNISTNIILTGMDDSSYYFMVVPKPCSVFLNDSDMDYPTDWSYQRLLNTFHIYMKRNKCNIYCENNYFKVVRHIKKGEELTKHYGI
jgi:hypothetical protein